MNIDKLTAKSREALAAGEAIARRLRVRRAPLVLDGIRDRGFVPTTRNDVHGWRMNLRPELKAR
jgi:hypothetical protein